MITQSAMEQLNLQAEVGTMQIASVVIRNDIDTMKDMLIQLKHRDFCPHTLKLWLERIETSQKMLAWFDERTRRYGALLATESATEVKSE